jgi:hypothetical protein
MYQPKILIRKCSSTDQRDAHCLEKIGPGRKHVHVRFGLFRLSFNVKVGSPQVSVEQWECGIPYGSHSGERGQPLLQVPVKIPDPRVLVFLQSRIDAEGQDVACIEAGIDIVQVLQRSYQQPRADQDNRRKRHLNQHESVADAQPSAEVRYRGRKG